MKVQIIRTEETEGTFGVLLIDEKYFCRTIEKPWRDNIPYESCIPEGVYKCKRVKSTNFGETFEVINVSGRSLIRFHWGSYVSDYRGCIGTGRKKEKIGRNEILIYTKDTFKAFMDKLIGINEFDFEIRRL